MTGLDESTRSNIQIFPNNLLGAQRLLVGDYYLAILLDNRQSTCSQDVSILSI